MISFIIPAYNAEKYITQCLESLTNQKKSLEYEVIVVDDGSKDKTGEIVTAFAENNPCIKYFYKENGGVSSARNYGLQVCKGEYISFLDADDYLVEDCFEYLKEYEEFDFIVYGYYYKTTRHFFDVLNNKGYEQYSNMAEAFRDLYKSNMFNSVWNKIYKKEYIEENFDENLVMGEDLIFNINYFKKVKSVKIINVPLYVYFVNDASVTQKYNTKYMHDFIYTREVLMDLKQYLGIESFKEIDKEFKENIVGTIGLLVHNYDYAYSIKEMKNLIRELEKIEVTEKAMSYFSDVIYNLFIRKKFHCVYIIMKIKLIVKKILQRKNCNV